MGADSFLRSPSGFIVRGPTRLRGRLLDTRDLRSGMALIAAALAAEGELGRTAGDCRTRYGQSVERLKSIGAHVERLETEAQR